MEALRFVTILFSLFGAVASNLSSPPNHANVNRRIGWWWDAPATASDPAVDALINFVQDHTNIFSSVLMRCGPTTLSGSITGDLSPACAKVIPALTSLGVESELWLGETDDVNAAIKLFQNPDSAISALIKLGQENPGVKGFNFDFEVADKIMCGSQRCDLAYAEFLNKLVKGLGSKYPNRWRVTADGACETNGWAPIIANCSILASGADKVMHMTTYNAKSYQQWVNRLMPAVADDVPLGKMGIGLGCWVDKTTNNTWAVTAKSAQERVCMLMNLSVTEIDMFRVAPEFNWPEAFWIPQLEKFMNGGGCDVPIPPKVKCPAKDNGWIPCVDDCPDPGCCTVYYAAVDMDLCPGVSNHEACAKQQCDTSSTNVSKWIPLNYSHHPYTCCPPKNI